APRARALRPPLELRVRRARLGLVARPLVALRVRRHARVERRAKVDAGLARDSPAGVVDVHFGTRREVDVEREVAAVRGPQVVLRAIAPFEQRARAAFVVEAQIAALSVRNDAQSLDRAAETAQLQRRELRLERAAEAAAFEA